MSSAIKSWDDAMDRVWVVQQTATLATQALEDVKNAHKAFSHQIVMRALKAIEDLKKSGETHGS